MSLIAPPSLQHVAQDARSGPASPVPSLQHPTTSLADVADDAVATPVAAEDAHPCPEREGLRKYICYGPCCAIPWGPGGPVFLAISGAAFRAAMPYTIIEWFQRDEEEQAEAEMRVDFPTLAFCIASFAASAPRYFEGAVYSFVVVVACLL